MLQKSTAKEGLRKKMDVLYGRVAELESRTKVLEEVVFDNEAEDLEGLPTTGDEVAAAEELEWFRDHLAPGCRFTWVVSPLGLTSTAMLASPSDGTK